MLFDLGKIVIITSLKLENALNFVVKKSKLAGTGVEMF